MRTITQNKSQDDLDADEILFKTPRAKLQHTNALIEQNVSGNGNEMTCDTENIKWALCDFISNR